MITIIRKFALVDASGDDVAKAYRERLRAWDRQTLALGCKLFNLRIGRTSCSRSPDRGRTFVGR